MTCLRHWDNRSKGWLIPGKPTDLDLREKVASVYKLSHGDESAAHQLVGGVMAHQGNDG